MHAIPNLTNLYLYLTEGCNCRCRHCWLAPKYEPGKPRYPVLDLELCVSVLDQALPFGLESVKLTGGEPLLHPQFDKILDLLLEKDRGLVLETNGLLCNRHIVEKIASCRDTFVSVSLDGVDARSHEWVRGVKGSFAKALSAIEMMSGAGIATQIIMSVMPHNSQQLEEIVRLAERTGAKSVKYNIVQPTQRGRDIHAGVEALTVGNHIEMASLVHNEISRTTDLKLIYDIPPAFVPLSILSDSDDILDYGTCRISNVLGLLPGGYYALCGIGSVVEEMLLGDASVDPLSEVWRNSHVLQEIRDGMPARLGGICSRCLMKDTCLGCCVAQNYYRTGNIWSPYWFCQSAWEEGMFPESRLITE